MVRNHRKPLKAMVATSKTIVNHWWQWSDRPKTFNGDGLLKNHWKFAMVSSKPLKFTMVPKKHWTCQYSSQINILLKQLNYPVVTITILIWLCCSKVYCQSSLINIVNLKTIVDQALPSKFWKPSKNHWFQWLDPQKKHSMVMVQLCQNHWKTIDGNGGLKKTLTIPSPWKIDHRCGLVMCTLKW